MNNEWWVVMTRIQGEEQWTPMAVNAGPSGAFYPSREKAEAVAKCRAHVRLQGPREYRVARVDTSYTVCVYRASE